MPGRIVQSGNTLGPPNWMGDLDVGRNRLALFPAKIDPDQFVDDLGVLVKLSAAALAGVNEVQTLTIDATGGTYTLTFGGQTTGAIAEAATAAVVEAALEALSTIGENDVKVTGAAGGPYTIEFQGALGKQNVAAIITDGALLTGGAGTAVIATTTPGVAAVTEISVDALLGTIPKNTLLRFGVGKVAYTTAAAAVGATSIAIEALVADLVDNDEAVYSGSGRKAVKSGTLLGRTFTERDAETGFGPAVHTDDEIFLLAFDKDDVTNDPDITLYRHQGGVKENLLPDWAAIAADANLLAALRSRYHCYKGETGA